MAMATSRPAVGGRHSALYRHATRAPFLSVIGTKRPPSWTRISPSSSSGSSSDDNSASAFSKTPSLPPTAPGSRSDSASSSSSSASSCPEVATRINEVGCVPLKAEGSVSTTAAARGGSVPPPHHYFSERQKVLEDLQGKHIYVFLDYDGTLTPIVSDPCQATLSPSMRQILLTLASSDADRITVGIVTGRALHSVQQFVQITANESLNFLYAASHGFHIEASGRQFQHRVGLQYIPILREAALKVAQALGHVEGVTLEDNEYAVSVHYRNAPAGSEALVESLVDEVLTDYPCLKKTKGKMVLELRINVVWDKGKAVEWLLKSMEVNLTDPQIRVVYVGDDLTDEDAFVALRELCRDSSIAVLVSESPDKRPTAATLVVHNTDEVADLLRDLINVVK